MMCTPHLQCTDWMRLWVKKKVTCILLVLSMVLRVQAQHLGFMGWIFTTDWPQNFGGKPHFPLACVYSYHLRVDSIVCSGRYGTYFLLPLNQIMPGVKKHIFHPRQTDDKFVMVIEVNDTNAAETEAFLKSTGAEETNIQIAESDWWYGRFDKKEDYEIQQQLA
jgi:hypothetical protein